MVDCSFRVFSGVLGRFSHGLASSVFFHQRQSSPPAWTVGRVGEGVLVPVDVFGGQAGGIGLGGAGVPEEFVEVAALGVGLAGCDGATLGGRDGALLLEHRARPEQARDDGFEEPFHAEGVVVDAAEVNVGRDFAIGQGMIEVLGPGLGDGEVSDAIEVLVFDGDLPTATGLVGFLGDDMLHDFLPGARGEFWVGAVQVDAGEGEVQMGLTFGVVVGLEEALGLGAVAGFEGGLLAGDFVFEVENTPGALDQSELWLHRFTHGCECEAVGTFPIREQWANSPQTGGELWAETERGEDSGETRTLFRS